MKNRQRVLGLVLALVLFMTGVTVLGAVPTNLSVSATDVTDVVLAAGSDGAIHAVWSDNGALYHRILSQGTWSVAEHIGTGWQPDLCAGSDGAAHLAFVAQPDDAQDVLYAGWTQAQGWGLATNVSQSDNASVSPAIAWDSVAGLAVTWSEASSGGPLIMWADSGDGAQWESALLPHATGTAPQAAFDADGDLTVVWEDVFDLGFPLEIMAATQDRAGGTWSLPEDVSFTINDASLAPVCVADDRAVWMAWEEVTEDGSAIMVTSRVDGEWEAAKPVTAAGDRHLPAMASDNVGTVHLAWLDGSDVYRSTMADVSAHWVTSDPISTGAESVSGLSLAVADSAFAAWLAGDEGIDRDAWAGEWDSAQAQPYSILLPLAIR